jgi:hypothetical protein
MLTLRFHEPKQTFSCKFSNISPRIWPPGNATARTLANNVAELCYRKEVVIIGNITTKPNRVVATLPAALVAAG